MLKVVGGQSWTKLFRCVELGNSRPKYPGSSDGFIHAFLSYWNYHHPGVAVVLLALEDMQKCFDKIFFVASFEELMVSTLNLSELLCFGVEKFVTCVLYNGYPIIDLALQRLLLNRVQLLIIPEAWGVPGS
ncbi:uncharacterized protein BDCG_08666 [Blastomyces dermatitidis ER-3]|uniref:Uncharacterized protein n=2 Tax=Ajellomyces dermatitidis TaxID=5039 RepID=F2T4P0_AJEDA|nr:uncharacterized protein BDCG_08666 [Blastomyces dermatitidis ER-3]EEQ85397.2 hypothetical protein BDCG_08666 [Blastomyces dermatitidis ER-3]EGE78468.2 hypothetical protein BDDG_01405 [Blastomyces dermatitidis ATCC 18188]